MPLILPLPTVIFQILFLFIAIASEAVIFNRLAGMNQRRRVEYAAAMELLVLCMGWACFFTAYELFPPAIQNDLQALILQGVWSSELNNWLLIVVPIVFFLIFELKSIAVQFLDLILKYPAPGADLGIPEEPETEATPTLTITMRKQLQSFFQRYQSIQSELAKKTIFWGHIASTGIGALVIAIQSILFALRQA
jgi:hypothetical protein